METIQNETYREQKPKEERNEQIICELWENIKWPHMNGMGIPKKKKKQGHKNVLRNND